MMLDYDAIMALTAWGKPGDITPAMQGVDLALIMHKLNPESIVYTKLYLGVTDDELQATAQWLNP